MRILIAFVLLSLLAFIGLECVNANARSLILTDQELRIAGQSLRAVLATNAKNYVRIEFGIEKFSNSFKKAWA